MEVSRQQLRRELHPLLWPIRLQRNRNIPRVPDISLRCLQPLRDLSDHLRNPAIIYDASHHRLFHAYLRALVQTFCEAAKARRLLFFQRRTTIEGLGEAHEIDAFICVSVDLFFDLDNLSRLDEGGDEVQEFLYFRQASSEVS
jgi:hypothetical protein